MTVLAARAVRAHRGGRLVLHDVDLSVEPGEVVAVIGPNGAGKSTLLDVLGGQLAPTSGLVELQGRVAMALQAPDLARRTALANVELALAWWGTPRPERRDRAREALALFGVEHLEGRAAASLSGGERRRVHLARAVAVRPDVLLLDEPFAGLDPAARASLLEDTGPALAEASAAVVVVVHDRAEAWALASRVVVLLEGRIAATGPPQQLLQEPGSPEVARFLGYTGALVLASGPLLTRPSHARLDPHGELQGVVTRSVNQEDTALLDVTVAEGVLQVQATYPSPQRGEQVRVHVLGGWRPDVTASSPRPPS